MLDQEVEEFVALCTSVLSEGDLTEEGAYQLGEWLNLHEAPVEQWPWNQLTEPLQAVWADGTANPQELHKFALLLISLQEEWARRQATKPASDVYRAPAAVYSYAPRVPTIDAPLVPGASLVRQRPTRAILVSPPSPSREGRSRWVLAAGSITILLVGAGLFAAREMRSAHTAPPVALSSPVVTATPVPSPSASLAPVRAAAVPTPAKPVIPSGAWTVVTRQSVNAKAGKKEIVIPKGTTVKVIGRSDRDLMISYKGEDLTIPASATTSSR